MSTLDNGPGLIYIYQGDFDLDGNLILDNLESGTHYLNAASTKHHNRLSLLNTTPNSFILLIEDSVEDGKTWGIQAKYTLH